MKLFCASPLVLDCWVYLCVQLFPIIPRRTDLQSNLVPLPPTLSSHTLSCRLAGKSNYLPWRLLWLLEKHFSSTSPLTSRRKSAKSGKNGDVLSTNLVMVYFAESRLSYLFSCNHTILFISQTFSPPYQSCFIAGVC